MVPAIHTPNKIIMSCRVGELPRLAQHRNQKRLGRMEQTQLAKKTTPKKLPSKFVFKPGAAASIGKIAAEEDNQYLKDCFLDAAHLARALDLEDAGSILVGRAGSGKSAALIEIQNKQQNVLEIDPKSLSLRFISNSNILQFFEALKIDLDLFYQVLWRHVLTIELLNYRFNVERPTDFKTLIERFKHGLFHAGKKENCIEYLKQHESDFFIPTQERIRSSVEKFETKLAASINPKLMGIPFTAAGALQLASETRAEIENQARNVISDVQIAKLSMINEYMADTLFAGRQNKYYIIIDRLDEDWVNDHLRFKLIRALIETIRAFRKVRSVKILVALREDLIERVYSETQTRGFQREKYLEFEIEIRWTKEQLFNLINKRISHLLKEKYTTQSVGFDHIFPVKYKGGHNPMFDHLYQRTLGRPRDIIHFVNEILAKSVGTSAITAKTVDVAEMDYSKRRLEALKNEWEWEHPSIMKCFEIFRGFASQFKLSDLPAHRIEALCVRATDDLDNIGEMARSVLDDKCSLQDFTKLILVVLYKIGFLSVRPGKATSIQSAHTTGFTLNGEEISDEMRFMIAPMVWRSLNITRGAIKGEVEHA